MAWNRLTRVADFASYLQLTLHEVQSARRQRSYIYVEEDRWIAKKRKSRHLCYPPRDSDLKRVQVAIKDKCLLGLVLNPAVRGYLPGQHNISVSQSISGQRYVAKLDIKDFHPSITPQLVVAALLRHGVSRPLCRILSQLVTYKNGVPQGASTSNHIANVVIDFVLSQGVLDFCSLRHVAIVNFGDDTAFAGDVQQNVDECVNFAISVFKRNGLIANSKSSCAEHIGASRKFIGTCTGATQPTYRAKNAGNTVQNYEPQSMSRCPQCQARGSMSPKCVRFGQRSDTYVA